MSTKNIIRHSSLISLMAVAMGVTALTSQVVPGSTSSSRPLPYIIVSGQAQASVSPDEAMLGLGVVTQESKAQDAQSAVGKAASAVLSAIHSLGVSKQDIQTSAVNLTPLHAAPVPGGGYIQDRPVTGYRASIGLTVTIRSLRSVGRVVDAAVAAGANQVNYVSFGLTNDRPARRKALAAAARDAKEKAETLARALNFKLGRVLEVTEGDSLAQPRFTTAFRGALRSAVAAESTPIESGKVKISSSVTMKVEIAGQLKSISEPVGGESSGSHGH